MSVVVPPPPPSPRRGLRTLLGLVAVLTGGALCCCLGGLIAVVGADGGPLVASRSLGTVVVPRTLSPQSAHGYRWRAGLRRYEVAYGASGAVKAEAARKLSALAARLRYHSLGKGEFEWAPPRSCGPEPWACVYAAVAQDNRENVEALAEAFAAYRRGAELDTRATVELVSAFVQSITYRMPEGQPFGLLPPTVVAADGWGDCDSKTMLAALILDELGIETVVLHSEALKHAALGVAIPGRGERFGSRGQRYLYVELTTGGWPVGQVPPEVDSPRLWTVVPWKRSGARD